MLSIIWWITGIVQMIKFVVLESYRLIKSRHYARIHRASCRHAREANHETASSFWHGYFDTYLEALRFAKSLDVEEVHECTFCDPRHGYNRVT